MAVAAVPVLRDDHRGPGDGDRQNRNWRVLRSNRRRDVVGVANDHVDGSWKVRTSVALDERGVPERYMFAFADGSLSKFFRVGDKVSVEFAFMGGGDSRTVGNVLYATVKGSWVCAFANAEPWPSAPKKADRVVVKFVDQIFRGREVPVALDAFDKACGVAAQFGEIGQ